MMERTGYTDIWRTIGKDKPPDKQNQIMRAGPRLYSDITITITKKANNVRYTGHYNAKEPFLQRKHSEPLLRSSRFVDEF
jgi:hypothetical protein